MENIQTDQQPTICILAMPADTNSDGDIFGGWIMAQVDIAGNIVATKRAQGRVVTVAIEKFVFFKPVYVGDLVSCYAKVMKVKRTSLNVTVKVFADRNRMGDAKVKVGEAMLTYVLLDKHRNPQPVPDI